MNLKDKAFLEKFCVKESSILIGRENFGATQFPIMGQLRWYSPHQSKMTNYPPKAFQLESEVSWIKTPLEAWPGLRTQLRYKAPGDLQVEIVKEPND